MPSSTDEQGRAAEVARPSTQTLRSTLEPQIDQSIVGREDIRVWEQSGVERLRLDDGQTVVLKYAIGDFDERDALTHVAENGVPVPRLLADYAQADGSVLMLLEDLGPELRAPTLEDAAQTAVQIHMCPGVPGRTVLDSAALSRLPEKTLAWIGDLREAGRWGPDEAGDIKDDLEKIARVADRRARGAEEPPFGLCHSEFHPTSIHIGNSGRKILDWARSYTGPGLLDLVSWQGTSEPLDLGAVSSLIDAYIAAGGPPEAAHARGDLPAHVWAGGWDKMWIIEWFLEGTVRWIADPADDAGIQDMIRVHLKEVVECLTD
ncbi:phosphotransferase family protein [Streptomonospora salina]|uniref:Aminoglycoside phosphotransferase domain-containing protein n=1 Tax=Streptomonospora salina TaxID=104205 RepID=A0A841EAT8_9ACTN|nr:phosphotransferase [Streptomonospora salina]MBB6000245.1 hypothetical protein [Streptomonospora salina]